MVHNWLFTTSSRAMFNLWQHLQHIKHYYYVSTPGPDSVMGWKGTGEGDVTTSYPRASENSAGEKLYFHESGSFELDANQYRLDTNNEFIWQRIDDGRVRLFHSRFGRDNQVELFDLIPQPSTNQWVSEASHLCGDDLYSGSVSLVEGQLEFIWQITGPRKDEHLHYIYKE